MKVVVVGRVFIGCPPLSLRGAGFPDRRMEHDGYKNGYSEEKWKARDFRPGPSNRFIMFGAERGT